VKSVFPKDSFSKIEQSICESSGVSTLVLMENAGRSCADFLSSRFPDRLNANFLILTGKGNNAGDGFVIARHLAIKRYKVNVGMIFGEKDLGGIALDNFNLLKSFDNSLVEIFDCKQAGDISTRMTSGCNIIVDCIFGIGLKGAPDDHIGSILSAVNSFDNITRVAVDIPSGLINYQQSSPCFKADTTLTMGAVKLESIFYDGRKHSGELHIMNIGIDETEFDKRNSGIYLLELSDLNGHLLSREIDSNKYTNGKLFIMSGSPGLTGATYLCSNSAMRTGCGAVIAGVPDSVFDTMEQKLTEVMKLSLADNSFGCISLKAYDQIYEKIDWADVVLIGPGLSKNEETMELVRRIVIENNTKRIVIDADAIHAFNGFSNLLKGKDLILTPHFGEFKGVCELEHSALMKDFVNESKNFTDRTGVTLVLKNAPTIVADSGRVFINSTGRENLATAGSGDVLSGIIAAIWAKSGRRLDSAIAGTMLHGITGDLMFTESGQTSTVAGDLIAKIPEAKKIAGMI
jgi:NAD(P)H-hydrate epimerase